MSKSKKTTKTLRKSPAEKASETPIGTVLKGIDKNYWIVKATANGIHRWVNYRKSNESESVYYIHDNGGRPFLVRITKKMINIYKSTNYDNEETITSYDIWIGTITPYQKVFVGIDPEYNYDGNSILVKIKPNYYMYIGSEIYTFRPKDKIIRYVSPVGNSDVPYPYAIGTDNTYLMIENVMIPNKYRQIEDPYIQYYDHVGEFKSTAKFFKPYKKVIKVARL
jgi:hypothetical protein